MAEARQKWDIEADYFLWAQEVGLVVERCCVRLDKGTEWAETIHVFNRTVRIESHLSPQPHITIHYGDH